MRLFLRVVFVLCVFLTTFSPDVGARHRSTVYDVSYLWHKNLDSVLEYKAEIQRILGKKVRRRLRVVVDRRGRYGLVYNRNGSKRSSRRVAAGHTRLLKKYGFEAAAPILDSGYHELFNISYGVGPHLKVLKKRFAKVYELLGSDVGASLIVEKFPGGSYGLTYRCLVDYKTARGLSRKHKRLLKPYKLSAALARETSNNVVYGESSFLDLHPSPLLPLEPRPSHAKKVQKKSLKTPDILTPRYSKKAIEQEPSGNLEAQIDSFIKELRRQGSLDADERTAWIVSDLVTGEVLASINKDQALQSASLIKPFVALAFFQKVKEGKLKYGPRSRRHMERMLQRSSNRSTNWVMRHVGGPATVNDLLVKNFPDIFQTTHIVEYIPASGRTYKNRASAEDYNRFLKKLWAKQLPHGKEIRRIMALPSHSRIYHGTKVPRGTIVYNKTGTTAHLCGDMGILAPRGADGRRYPYTLVAIIEKKGRPVSYGRWMLRRGNVIRKVSNLVYSEMKKRHNLL